MSRLLINNAGKGMAIFLPCFRTWIAYSCQIAINRPAVETYLGEMNGIFDVTVLAVIDITQMFLPGLLPPNGPSSTLNQWQGILYTI